MKKLITVIAASLLLGSSVFAEGYLSANDLTVGEIKANQNEEDGFVINASAEKFVVVEDKSKESVMCDGEKIVNRLSTKGSGNAKERSVSFPAKSGETIYIYAQSSGKSGSRSVHVINADGAEIAEVAAGSYTETKDVKAAKVKVPANGTYTVYPTGGTLYIYMIKVAK